MASLRQNENYYPICKNCTTRHSGECRNHKYLANLYYKCGCNKNDIQLRNFGRFKNHCCYCKKESKFSYCKWDQEIIGKIMCKDCQDKNNNDQNDEQDRSLYSNYNRRRDLPEKCRRCYRPQGKSSMRQFGDLCDRCEQDYENTGRYGSSRPI